MLIGAYDLGIALHNAIANAERRAKARKAAEEAARLERIRLDSLAAVRRREAAWAKLSGEFRFSAPAGLEMRLDTAKSELSLRFDHDTTTRELTSRELRARDRTNCFFMSCGEKYEMPDEQWTTPYVDLRNLRRAAHLVRRTLYAPAENRESLIDNAVEVAQGSLPQIEIPTDGVVLPENALERMQLVSVDRKLATNHRVSAAVVVDSLQQRRELIAALSESVLAVPQAREQSAAMQRLVREKLRVDSALASAHLQFEAATQAEALAIRAERNRLVATTLSNAAPGRPVEACAEERAEIESIRAGFANMDDMIARMDATAAKHRADASATIARAKDAGAAAQELLLDPVKDALKAFKAANVAHAQRRALIMSLTPSKAREADRWRRGVNVIWDQIDELQSANEKVQASLAKSTAEARATATNPSSGNDVFDIMESLDRAGLLSPVAGGLASLRGLKLSPYVTLGEAFIRSFTLSADAVSDDRAAQAMRTYANRMREQRRHLGSLADEREARLREIETTGGCVPH